MSDGRTSKTLLRMPTYCKAIVYSIVLQTVTEENACDQSPYSLVKISSRADHMEFVDHKKHSRM